ncbi:MAG: acyltransferase [Pseudomonadales bacterium]|nr:acyltransferase [Pseudomonadales bacterium]
MGIELFRGIAALMVLLTHYARFISSDNSALAFLWTGVDLFFVISGYVFAPMVLGPKTRGEASGKNHVTAYLLRRFFRLYPLYLFALILYYFFSPAAPEKLGYFIRHLFFLHTTASTTEAYFFNPAFWSLPVEVEFYLALPLLALLGGSARKLGLLFGLSLLLGMSLNYLRGPEDLFRVLSVHLTGILPEFIVGIFLHQAVQRTCTWPLALLVALLGAGIISADFLLRYGDMAVETNALLNAPFNFMAALGYALLMFPVLRIRDTAYPSWLASLALLSGALSYGVYLFHNLMPRILLRLGMEQQQGWAFFLLCTFLTLAMALLCYHFLENPARQYGRRLSARQLGRAGDADMIKRQATLRKP